MKLIKVNNNCIVSIEEKPLLKNYINSGVYVLDKEAFNYIPKNEFFNMTDLFESIISDNAKASVFNIIDYWRDIGQMQDYELAQLEFKRYFSWINIIIVLIVYLPLYFYMNKSFYLT